MTHYVVRVDDIGVCGATMILPSAFTMRQREIDEPADTRQPIFAPISRHYGMRPFSAGACVSIFIRRRQWQSMKAMRHRSIIFSYV